MYNDYNENQDRTGGEYHYSYRSDSDGFQPAQPPAPMEVKPRKRWAGRIVAAVVCAALLTGGAFGAGWYLNRDGGRSGSQVMLSDRPLTEVTTVSVNGSDKLTFSQIYRANKDSCVSINVSSVGYNIFYQPVQTASSGSGFILTADGYIVTNCHVVNGATDVQVTLDDGTTYTAQVVGSDADYDIAVLKVDPARGAGLHGESGGRRGRVHYRQSPGRADLLHERGRGFLSGPGDQSQRHPL